MKKYILALLLASTVISCSANETKTVETKDNTCATMVTSDNIKYVGWIQTSTWSYTCLFVTTNSLYLAVSRVYAGWTVSIGR